MGDKKEVKQAILFRRGIKIQGLNRVALPRELLENVDLKEGDNVALFLDTNSGNIILKKDNGGENA